MPLLPQPRIMSVHQIAVDMGATNSRATIVSCLPAEIQASLSTDLIPANQLLNDLNTLNRRVDKAPLETYLNTLIHLNRNDLRHTPIIAIRDELRRLPAQHQPAPPPPPANLSPTLDELLKLQSNKSTFEKLLKQAKSIPIVPFAGAGLSKACGMPMWAEFIKESAAGSLDEPTILKHLNVNDYESAAECLLNTLGLRDFADKIDDAFGDRISNEIQLKGAVLQLPAITKGPVVTTNFDRILERAFAEAHKPFKERVWGAKADMFVAALSGNEPYLLKVHGDAMDRTDRVLTLSDYSKHYGNTQASKIDMNMPLPKALQQVVTTRTLLFLGCSLENDRTMQIIHHVASKHGAPPAHYAIVELPREPKDIAARKKLLSDHNIRPLFFPPGEFDKIEVFLKGLSEAN